MPKTWTDFGPGWAIAITAGVLSAITALHYSPRGGPRPSASARRAAWTARRPSRAPALATVTGLRRLVLKGWLSTAGLQITMPLLLMGGMRAMDSATGDVPEAWLDYARWFGLMPFDRGADSHGMPWIMLSVFSSIMGTDSVAGMLRHLRVLPLTTRQLNLTLMAFSAICWANAWFVLAGVHLLMTGQAPESWQLPMFFAFAGYDCLVRAFQLRWRGMSWFLVVLPLLVAAGVLIAKYDVPVTAAFLLTGPSAFALAY